MANILDTLNIASHAIEKALTTPATTNTKNSKRDKEEKAALNQASIQHETTTHQSSSKTK